MLYNYGECDICGYHDPDFIIYGKKVLCKVCKKAIKDALEQKQYLENKNESK